jgi:hypothetical protein
MFPIPGTFTLQAAAIAVVAAFLVGSCAGVGGTYAFYSPQLELAQKQAEVCGEKLNEQNEAVAKLRDVGKARAAKAAKAVASARKAASQAQSDALLLLQVQPKPGEDRCAAAAALIRKELKK